MNKLKIFVSAGEPSGETHAARMIEQVNLLGGNNVSVSGIGGSAMEAAGAQLLCTIDRLAIMGLVEVLRHLPFFRELLGQIRAHLIKERPALVVLVDYPDFNLQIAKIARKLRIPVLYYISPQIWAWRTGRKKKIARLADRMAVVFPFEVEFYADQPLEVEFVGHPLMEVIGNVEERGSFCGRHGLDSKRPILGVMPGSRVQEIGRHFTDFVRAAAIVRSRNPEVQPVLALLDHTADTLNPEMKKMLETSGVTCLMNDSRNLIAASTALITKSGTTTMEACLLGTPMVIGYRTSALSYKIARRMIKVKHIGMPNLLAPETAAVPELVQDELSAENLARIAERLLDYDDILRQRIISQYICVRELLTRDKPASVRCAEIALEMCGHPL